MAMTGIFRVSGKDFRWYVEPQTSDYLGFSAGRVDVLRITSCDGDFDIALMLRAMEFHGGSQILVASPLIVLSKQFPTPQIAVEKGARIRVRPKVTVFRDAEISNYGVRRIVEWCLSRHFRAVRCDIYGLPQMTAQDDYSLGVPPPRVLDHTTWQGKIT